MFIELGRGPLAALKHLLTDPLRFDAQQYIDKTAQLQNRQDILDLRALAVLFEKAKQTLMPRLAAVPLILQSHRQLLIGDITVGFSSPIKFGHPEQSTNSDIRHALLVKQIDTINLHVDQLSECFQLRQSNGDRLMLNELAEFISFYHFSEALFLVFCGFGHVKKMENHFSIFPGSKNTVRQFHREWLARYWESTSAQANIAYTDFLPYDAIHTPVFEAVIHEMGKGLRDKIFSIPSESYSDRLTGFESLKLIDKMCTIVSLCLWCLLKGQMSVAPYSLLQRVGVMQDDIEQLKQLQSSVFAPDRIFDFRNDGIRLANPSFTIQLRQLLVKLFALLPKEESGRINQVLGEYFEKDYLREYFSTKLNEVETHYIIHPGILDHEVPKIDEKLDIDFIVEDCRRQRLLFAQVKYLKAGGTAYLLGDLQYAQNTSLQNGISQIRAAKNALSNGHLTDILQKRGLGHCTLSNSTFLVIHNVPNLDFQMTSDGISLYEWNTLRNLLQDGRCTFGHTRESMQEWRYHEPLPIENPDATIEILISHSPVCKKGGGHALMQSDFVTSEFEMAGYSVTCSGLGI